MDKEQLRKEAEQSWDEINSQFEKGVNPHAYVLGYKAGRLRSDEEKDKRIEELEEFVKQFIPDPYPEDIFLPVSSDELKQIHALLQIKFKMPIDRLTGHIGRVLRNPLREQATQLLTKNPQ